VVIDALPRQFTVSVIFNYVLIIEWLRDDDEKTGTVLFEQLDKQGTRVMHASCQTAEGVRQVLTNALADVPKNGIPAIHIEAHGIAIDDDVNADPAFGGGGGERICWSEIGALLAPLNVASDFRLLLVAAACYGQAAISAMSIGKHAAPFAACIGYTTRVTPASIRESMLDLYADLLKRNKGFDDAIASARRQLYKSEERLEAVTALMLAYQMIRTTCEDLSQPGRLLDPQVEAVERRARHERAMSRLVEVWDGWFPREVQSRKPDHKPEPSYFMRNPS
jgi:hypothetical protein